MKQPGCVNARQTDDITLLSASGGYFMLVNSFGALPVIDFFNPVPSWELLGFGGGRNDAAETALS